MRDTGEVRKRTFPESRWLAANEGHGMTGAVPRQQLTETWSVSCCTCGTGGRWEHRLALSKPGRREAGER